MTKKRTVPLFALLVSAALALTFYCAAVGCAPGKIASVETAERDFQIAEQLAANVQNALADNRCGEILLSGQAVTASCPGVTVGDQRVEITAPGIYRVSGSLDGGSVSVRCKGNVGLVLNGVSVLNPDGPAISVEDAAHVQLWLAEGTENRLVSGTQVEITGPNDDNGEEEASGAAVYGKDTLSIAGTGVLIAEGYLHNAISSTDHIVILDGELRLTAVNNGIRGKDSVTVRGGKITVLCGNDGIHSVNGDQENQITGAIRITGGETEIRCYGDGLHAGKDLLVLDGTVTVTAGNVENLTLNSAREAQMPEGMEMPDGMQPPEGMEMPDGMQPPDRIEKPDETGEAAGFAGRNGSRGPFGGPGGGMDFRGTRGNGFNAMEGNPNKTDESSGGKGLKSGGNLTVSGGSVTVTSADDSIHADDEVCIQGGNLHLISGNDGVHGTNRVTVRDGTVDIRQAYEGVEGHEISVEGGTVSVIASDDGFNANGGADMFSGFFRRESTAEDIHPVLRITGGKIHVNADGDGLDSNGDLVIQGGTTIVDGPENGGNGALDSGSEIGGLLTADGGTILAVGSSEMAESFGTQSTQCSFSQSFASRFQAGTEIRIQSQDGENLFAYTSEKTFNSVVFSSPDLRVGETVLLTVGEETVEVKLDGISNGNSNGLITPGDFGGFMRR